MFNNASEVVRDALRRQQQHLLKLEALRRDIGAGAAFIKAGDVSNSSAYSIIAKVKAR